MFRSERRAGLRVTSPHTRLSFGAPTVSTISASLKAPAVCVETICSITPFHSFFFFLLFQYPSIAVSLPPPPPPLAVMEVVSVMAVGRLPAAGEILINSLFICVERRAPAF